MKNFYPKFRIRIKDSHSYLYKNIKKDISNINSIITNRTQLIIKHYNSITFLVDNFQKVKVNRMVNNQSHNYHCKNLKLMVRFLNNRGYNNNFKTFCNKSKTQQDNSTTSTSENDKSSSNTDKEPLQTKNDNKNSNQDETKEIIKTIMTIRRILKKKKKIVQVTII